MDIDEQPTQAATPTAASSDAASAPPRSGYTLRGRKWIYGATLAAAGVIAGSGVTYAVVNISPASQSAQVQAVQPDQTTGRPAGGPPGGAPPDGTAPNGTAPDGAPTNGG